MLGKLIKNEFKATSRNFIPVYLLMIIVSIFMKIMGEITDNANSVWADSLVMDVLYFLAVAMFVIAIVAVVVGTAILIIKRFYDNMLKDEGYLSFTLPVTTGQHIASKALVSYIWVIASVAVIIMSIIILLLGDSAVFIGIKNEFLELIKIINQNSLWKYVIGIVAIVIISVYSSIMMAYTCLSVGQIFSKHRIAGAFITYIVIYIISQIIGSIFLSTLLVTNNMPSNATVIDGFFQPFIIYSLVLSIVEAVVFTVITHIMLNRNLNLE